MSYFNNFILEDEVRIYEDEGDNESMEILNKEKSDLVNEVEKKFFKTDIMDLIENKKVPEDVNFESVSQESYLQMVNGDKSKMEGKFMRTIWNFCCNSLLQNTEPKSNRPQTTASIIPSYPTESVSIPLDTNFFLANNLQKPIFEQEKYNEIYCNPVMYSRLYPEDGYSNIMPVSPEWRQTVSQPIWDVKIDPKSTITSNTELDDQYFAKSNITYCTCPQDIGSSSTYRPLDTFPRTINSIKGSQYYYPTTGFGNMESGNLSRISSNYSSDNSSFSSLSPKISFEINKSSKVMTELNSPNEFDNRKTHIKKPLNAFMLFMKEMRSRVVAECTLKESAAINQILGRRWHALTREEQTKYYEMARKEKELHQQLYPNWSARDNYASHTKRKKKRTNTLFQMSYFNHGNCFKNSNHMNAQKFQPNLTQQSINGQNSIIIPNKRGIQSNHNFFYKPSSSYHINPLLALHYGSSFTEKLIFSNSQPCFNSNWPTLGLTDSSININKDCLDDIHISSSHDNSVEKEQNEFNILNQPIISESRTTRELEAVDHSQCRKEHLLSESAF